MKIILEKTIDDYLNLADEVTVDSRTCPHPLYVLVKEIDQLNRDVWTSTGDFEPTIFLLGLNSYFSFLSAVRVAISGHVSTVFPIIRSALESSCYGFLISRDKAKASTWLNRDSGPAERKLCRAQFTSAAKDTAAQLRTEGHDSLAEMVMEGYEAAITFGAHPNAKSVSRNLAVRPADQTGQVPLDFTSLYGADSFEVAHALLACVEYGLMISILNYYSSGSLAVEMELLSRFNSLHDRKEKEAAALRG